MEGIVWYQGRFSSIREPESSFLQAPTPPDQIPYFPPATKTFRPGPDDRHVQPVPAVDELTLLQGGLQVADPVADNHHPRLLARHFINGVHEGRAGSRAEPGDEGLDGVYLGMVKADAGQSALAGGGGTAPDGGDSPRR